MKKDTTGHTKERLKASILATGAIAVGVAEAGEVDRSCLDHFDRWLDAGNAAGMDWLRNHRTLRRNPAALLDGARSVVSIAYPYAQPRRRHAALPQIAMYAYGKDYHKVIPKLLRPVCQSLQAATGAATRICVDSAPIPERYWAMKAGIGRLGDNGSIIIDGYGSFVFLCEIITTLPLPPDSPSTKECMHCGRCRTVCPGRAISCGSGAASIRPQRCLSYLTIEQRGELPTTGESAAALDSAAGLNTLYGCDICQLACPYNADTDPSLTLPQFLPAGEAILSLSAADAKALDADGWDALTIGSAMRRARAEQLQRNAARLRPASDKQ